MPLGRCRLLPLTCSCWHAMILVRAVALTPKAPSNSMLKPLHKHNFCRQACGCSGTRNWWLDTCDPCQNAAQFSTLVHVEHQTRHKRIVLSADHPRDTSMPRSAFNIATSQSQSLRGFYTLMHIQKWLAFVDYKRYIALFRLFFHRQDMPRLEDMKLLVAGVCLYCFYWCL